MVNKQNQILFGKDYDLFHSFFMHQFSLNYINFNLNNIILYFFYNFNVLNIIIKLKKNHQANKNYIFGIGIHALMFINSSKL